MEKLQQTGMNGGYGRSEGGSSGGGSINIFANIIKEKGNVLASGGTKGGKGGEGSVTINELGSILNYPEKRITLNIKDTYKIDSSKLSYIKLNEIQTEDLSLGNIVYEAIDNSLISVDNTGNVVPKALGTARVKITDETNKYSTYIVIDIIEEVAIAKVKIADGYTLALKENGTVWTFGDTGVTTSDEPVQVMVNGNEFENIVDIGAGNKIMIALDDDGKVYTWGSGAGITEALPSTGTGTGTGAGTSAGTGENNAEASTPEAKEEPSEVLGLANVVAIDAFGDNFYAVDSDGFAYIWGKEYAGPTKIDTKYKMVDVDGKLLLGENGFAFSIDKPNEKNSYLNSIVSIAYADDHSLFAKADGHVLSMGEGADGQLGSGYTASKNYANFVKTEDGEYLSDCYEVSCGYKTSMAVDTNGIAYVWGDNTKQKLGAEALKVMYATPVSIVQDKAGNDLTLPKFELAEAGTNHMAIADTDGYVYSIGLNSSGELGLEDTKDRTRFTKISGVDIITVPKITEIALGQTKDVTICLGNGFNLKTDVAMGGKIGAFTANNKKLRLEPILGVDNSSAKKEKDLVPNFRITGNGIARSEIIADAGEGYTKNIWINVVEKDGSEISAKTVSADGFTFALRSNGEVFAFGNINNSNHPVKIETDEKIIDISAGKGHVVLLGISGKVYTMGLGSSGQLRYWLSWKYESPNIY